MGLWDASCCSWFFKKALCLSEYLYLNKDDYFDILSTTQYSGGYVRQFKFSLRAIDEAVKNSICYLQQYEEAIKPDEEKLKFTKATTKSLLMVYNYLKEYPIACITVIEEQSKMSYNSVHNAIDMLAKQGIVLQEKTS